MTEWVNIEDKLPEFNNGKNFNTVIIASWSVERKIYHVSPAYWRENKFVDMLDEIISIDDGYWKITHWQPLPQSPE